VARLYANENFPLPAVEQLRRLGHNVLTVQETGKAEQSLSDEEGRAHAVTWSDEPMATRTTYNEE